MKINIAKTAGFCFGVKRAIETALQTAKDNRTVEMLGDIVHNEDVIKRVKASGIKKVAKLTRGENKTLLIRAHGTGTKTYREAEALGYHIVDATCPMVTEIHNIAKKMEKEGYKIIIIGDKNHSEVQGIAGQLTTAPVIISSKKNIPLPEIKGLQKAAIVIQSTQTIENADSIHRILKPHIADLKLFNTICKTTRSKQAEIKTLPRENDVVFIIGSKTSANTKRLYQISKTINPRTYRIMSAKEIDPVWLKNAEKIGISAGASTPGTAIESVVSYLKSV